MKTFRWKSGGGQVLLLSVSIIMCGPKIFAQTTDTNSLVPTVTLVATDPIASQGGDPGAFTVFRHGNTNLTLNVFYQIGGTASNGVDYAQLGNWVVIPAGAPSGSITITPINPNQTNTVRVVLHLAPSPLMTPINFAIDSPDTAAVYIEGMGVTNLPPWVNIVRPANGTVFYTPTNIQILASVGDLDGYVAGVEFFAGTNDLGNASVAILDPPGIDGVVGPVAFLTWSNAPPGSYALTAVATDAFRASTTSDPVDIIVKQGPPPTNVPPVVRIVSPANGSVFLAPIDIPLFAYARDGDGFVASVEFFAGTNSLGFGQPLSGFVAVNPSSPGPVPPVYPTNLFYLVWSNASIGTDSLTAEATDNDGASTVSDPVIVTILPSPPPPTNHPPIVSIVATDPVAVEGTNCWVWRGVTNSSPTWAEWSASSCRFFTNCGPKTATFAVRRWGSTNGDLTVPYVIGGSASNGVDYAALPGYATIPAGARRTLITIVPIDDGPPDVNKTVLLKLTPSTSLPPDYLLGFPRHAAAVIIDSDGPRPGTGLLPGRLFHFSAAGPDAAWFWLEYSTNLVHWTAVCTNQVIDGSIDFVDPDAQSEQSRFYRAVPLTNPPME
jgi:Bacterial Ig domain